MDFESHYYGVFVDSYSNGNLIRSVNAVILALESAKVKLPDPFTLHRVVTHCVTEAFGAGVEFNNIHKFDVFLERIYRRLAQRTSD